MRLHCCVAFAFAAGIAYGQQGPGTGLSFEAASIKPLQGPVTSFHYNVLPNRLDAKAMDLRELIEDAFDLPDFELSVPDSTGHRNFDIMATTGAPVSRAEMRIMLKNLLIERFHLATHWDTRTQAIYRLEVLPAGPKMKVSAEGYAGSGNSPTRHQNGSMEFTGPMSMRQLAGRMTQFVGKPVLDATGLDGYFRIVFVFTPDDPMVQATETSVPFLPKAAEEQLGLKLVPSKETIKVLVVDHADDVPTAN